VTLLLAFLARQMTSRMPHRRMVEVLFPVVAALEVLFIVVSVPLSHDGASEQIAMLDNVLRAIRAPEYVMDATGEAVFRPRPFYYALEAFTRVRIARGLIHDDIVDVLIGTRTAVVLPRGLTKSAKLFVQENYLDVGHDVSILGKRLILPGRGDPANPILFKVLIPGSYRVLRDKPDDAMGKLDGNEASGPMFLDAGQHTFQNSVGDHSGACIFWNAAFERGVTPTASW
jgi:hypothetical protein